MSPTEKATPTNERCVTSYPARRNYRPGVVFPPQVPGVIDAIDIHCHAHEGQQDALALGILASESKMKGIVYKTIGSISGEYRPAENVRQVRQGLEDWASKSGERPIQCWAGYGVTMDNKAPSVEKLKAQLQDGVSAVWLPVFNHANTYNRVGGRKIWMDPKADPREHTEPLSWEEALRYGHYMLGENGKLKPLYDEIVRIVADQGAALFFGHATHPEIWALAELTNKLGYKRAVIDHPFSPFIDLTISEMKELSRAGIYMNFTYDELSPLLGVDPKNMYDAIRAIGVDMVTISSDAGEPLFPHSVECMRLVRGYMEAFGLNKEELHTICSVNPSKIVELH